MAAIGLDILDIGTSRWDREVRRDITSSIFEESQFMLPAVPNVRDDNAKVIFVF